MGIMQKYLSAGFALVIGCIATVGMTSQVMAQGVFDAEFFESDMIQAVMGGDPDLIHAQITAGGSANDRTNSGTPAIVLAARDRNLPAVEVLAEAGARLDARDREDGSTALTVAAELDARNMFRRLLEFGADPDQVGGGSEGALIKAARLGHPDIIEILIEVGADLEATDLTGSTALDIARIERHRRVIQLLEDAGAY